jgi:DNA-binding beta-propeller fold protein YncE
MRILTQTTADLVWDATRNRIYASVQASATGNYKNNVIAIDPTTLQITGSLPMNQDPGKLALASGGEFLYVALNANGTVAKINLPDLTLNSTFTVGTDATFGTTKPEMR